MGQLAIPVPIPIGDYSRHQEYAGAETTGAVATTEARSSACMERFVHMLVEAAPAQPRTLHAFDAIQEP